MRGPINLQTHSEAKGVEVALTGLQELINTIPDKRTAGEADTILMQAENSFEAAFQRVGQLWGKRVEKDLHEFAAANSGEAWHHWTRHLYAGGNPKSMGNPGFALFEIYGKGDKSSVWLDMDVADDMGTPSWSPVANSEFSEEGRAYPPWPERAKFMLANFLPGQRDGRIITGDRRDMHGPWGETGSGFDFAGRKYIISKDPSPKKKYIFADHFRMDYSVQKAQRDDWFSRKKDFTANLVLDKLDKGFRRALDGRLIKLETEARAVGAQGAVNSTQLLRSPIRPSSAGSMKRFGHDAGVGGRYATAFAAAFRREMERGI